MTNKRFILSILGFLILLFAYLIGWVVEYYRISAELHWIYSLGNNIKILLIPIGFFISLGMGISNLLSIRKNYKSLKFVVGLLISIFPLLYFIYLTLYFIFF